MSEALDKIDLSQVPLYADRSDGSERTETHGYWWLTANPKIWSFADIKIGEEQSYTLYNDNGNKRRVFQNFLDAKVGDIVIGYEANPVKKVVAIGRITQENDGQALYFEKVEGLSTPIEYQTLRGCPELEKMEFFVQPNGSLFKLTKRPYVSKLLGKATIDTNTYGQSKGRNGSYSVNWQLTGRELLMPDEVRMLDNQYALLFIRGERPIQDFKYDILKHPH